jgi:hypothetical protein
MTTNYLYMLEAGPQTVLKVGDTVSSPTGSYLMKLETTGLSVTAKGGNKDWIVRSCVGVESCELTLVGLVIKAAVQGWTDPVTGFIPYVLDVLDSGEVVILNEGGSAQQIVYSYQGGAGSMLRLYKPALDELNARIEELEKRARIESGFPGPLKKNTGT